MAYIQDSSRRLSLLVNHAQGAASWQPGWLEVMLDRRTLYDDSRGMGEGIVDNKRMLTKFWLLLEEVKSPDSATTTETFSRPSLFAHHLSNSLLYPANLFVVEGMTDTTSTEHQHVEHHHHHHHDAERDFIVNKKVVFLSRPLPCDVHLMNLRTLSDVSYTQFPSQSALMVLQRQGYACDVGTGITLPQCSLEVTSSNSADRSKSSAFHKRTFFSDLHLGSIVQTSLTGLHHIHKFQSLDEIEMSPMELLSLNVTFVL
jgi:Glycosyl hydrolases family 38 C-terminal domain.